MSGSGHSNDSWRPEVKPTPVPSSGAGGAPGGAGVAPQDPCNIVEATILNSPDRTVISTLRAGDVLEVAFLSGPPQRLVARTQNGAIAGSITSPSMPQIIQCITQRNVAYVADVTAVTGGMCAVSIRPQ
jgi:hypothetical protein